MKAGDLPILPRMPLVLGHENAGVVASIGAGVRTAYRAIKKALPFLEPDHHALLIGLGGLGQYGLKLLKLLSGCPLIIVNISDQKLELAVIRFGGRFG